MPYLGSLLQDNAKKEDNELQFPKQVYCPIMGFPNKIFLEIIVEL
jgi:hypothetical protein